MGDPISPAMTIGALAWMERRWMRDEVGRTAKRNFMARRYMDDILLFYAENQGWDSAKMVADFEKSECYDSPLKLEEGGQGTFLETSFEIKENAVRFWLKNQNSGGEKQVWRYQHYESYASYQQKRATLMACLRKVQKMASDRQALERSAWDKIVEFRELGYPRRVLRTACNYLGATTGERGWFEVRDQLGF